MSNYKNIFCDNQDQSSNINKAVDMLTIIEEMNLHSSSNKNFLIKLDLNEPISHFYFTKTLKG